MSPKIFNLIIAGILLYIPAIAQQNLKICAIRVEFREDNNELTTGNGKFMFDISGVTPYTVDPPPHNRPYFQDQITAVRNYYLAASKNNLSITGDVFPLARDNAYQLEQTMGFYNPNSTDQENNARLAQLFIDAVRVADQDADFNFSDYDVVTVFHAGVGKDIDLGFDETPQDIPSIYFTPEFFRKYYDSAFTGILVDDGNTLIDSGLLLPETESQVEIEIGITGMFAANLGSHLGMYDLFSPSEQKSAIGTFGIMDAGLFNALGLAPALPSAFSRYLMGWESPKLLNYPAQNVTVHRFEGAESLGQTLFKIPLNTTEYYLLENRGERQINLDSLYFEIAENRQEPPTYLEVMKTYLSDRIEVSDSTGVLLKIDNYDWGLPGAGILIWHIDEQILAEKGPENRVNEDRENRAVDVEEADGSQDIGFEYTVVEPGYQSELGTWLDFWFKDNPAPLYQNEFSARTSPNTRSNRTLANSHIILRDFSDNFTNAMTFSYQPDYFEPGFPVELVSADSPEIFTDPVAADIDFENRTVIFTSNNRGTIFGITAEGKGIFDSGKFDLAQSGISELQYIALGDTNLNETADILFSTGESGTITAYRIEDRNNDYLLDTLWTRRISEKITTEPVIENLYMYFGTAAGNIYRYNSSGIQDSVFQFGSGIAALTVLPTGQVEVTFIDENIPGFPPIIADMNGEGEFEKITCTNFYQIDLAGITINLEEPVIASPALADIDNDGFYEIIINTVSTIYAYNYNGSLVTNFPLHPVLQSDENLAGTPLLFDTDGDKLTDVVVTTTLGQVFAYSLQGEILTDFPFSAGGNMIQTAAVKDIDNDGLLELCTVNNNALVYTWQLNSNQEDNELWWYQAGYRPTKNRYIARQLNPSGLPVRELMPSNRAYAYPNPNIENYTNIRYYLREQANVNIKIFDLAGDLVDSFTGPGQSMADNEIRWNLEGVSSGVYLCRIEALSAGDSSVRIIKIMVIN